jgi:type II secretory pathway component PulL
MKEEMIERLLDATEKLNGTLREEYEAEILKEEVRVNLEAEKLETTATAVIDGKNAEIRNQQLVAAYAENPRINELEGIYSEAESTTKLASVNRQMAYNTFQALRTTVRSLGRD